MAAKAKRKFSLKPDKNDLVKAQITATVTCEKWEWIENWLNEAPDCADGYEISIVSLTAEEV